MTGMASYGRLRAALLVGLAAIIVAGAVFWGGERYFLGQLGGRAANATELHRENLNGWLGRFRALPSVFARHPQLLATLENARDLQQAERAVALLEYWTASTGAQQSYLVDRTGRVVAASNWTELDSSIGRIMVGRPHFREAMEGRLGRWFEVDRESGSRGYHFAFPVRRGTSVAGVIVVMADVAAIEEELRLSPNEVFVADADGVIVLSGHPELRLTRIGGPARGLEQTPVSGLSDLAPPRGELVVGRPDRSDRTEQEFLHLTRPVATEGWTLHMLVPTAAAHAQAFLSVIVSGLVAAVVTLAGQLVIARRRLLIDRLEAREREGRLLEQKVATRTAALSAANDRLAQEVRERAAAEDELRQAQADLVQAGKLAVLGQMSTALSHEFNQPLTAIRSYAENADAFVEQGREDRARENLARIMRLTARMAQLSRRLSNFARKPSEGMEDVVLASVFEEALELMDARLARADVVPEVVGLTPDLTVRAGAIRLQHVLMNLIGNALDATEGQADAMIRIGIEPGDGTVRIVVEDNGPGVPDELRERIFDPFFTTKDVGRGVGLGLSISYNIVRDFHGRIEAEAVAGTGARLVVTLSRGAPVRPVLEAAE